MQEIHPDPNLRVDNAINKPDCKLYDVRKPPFALYGFYKPTTEPVFKRLPDDVAEATNKGVACLYRNTAGGRVRFSTDSPYIAIHAEIPDYSKFSHMSLLGIAGFDLYIDDPKTGISRFRKSFVPPYGGMKEKDGFESVIDLPDGRMRSFTIHFPLYADVKNLYIGVREGAKLEAGCRYREKLPIVYYGSSITQGACASRPGNAYQNIISRNLNLDHVNLGFSGNALAEKAIVDYMATMPMLAFVSDYDHNADDPDYLRESNKQMYQTIRKSHPDIPYILISRPDFEVNLTASLARRDAIFDVWKFAREVGDKNVWLIDGASIFRGRFCDGCTVDGVHPNDLGFALFAEKLEDELRHILIHESFDF